MDGKPSDDINSRDLELYTRIIRGELTRAELAAEYGITRRAVNIIYNRVSDTLRPEFMDSIRKIRQKHGERLEMLVFFIKEV